MGSTPTCPIFSYNSLRFDSHLPYIFLYNKWKTGTHKQCADILSQITNENFEISNIETKNPSTCKDYEPLANRFINFSFDDDRLIASDKSGKKQYYERDYEGNYCRRLNSGADECISDLAKDSYNFYVNELGKGESCYSATITFILDNQQASEESIDPVSEEEEKPTEEEEKLAEEEQACISSCNATYLIEIIYGEGKQLFTDDKTPYCVYELTIKNSNENESI